MSNLGKELTEIMALTNSGVKARAWLDGKRVSVLKAASKSRVAREARKSVFKRDIRCESDLPESP